MLTALLGEQLGEGGEGIVYALPDSDQFLASYRRKVGTVVGKGPFVFKHYHKNPDWQRLVRLVQWLETRSWSVRNEVSATTTWPLVLVTDPQPDNSPTPGTSGIIMRRLDDDFFMTLQTMGRTARKYRVVDYLSWNTTQAAQVSGFEFPRLQQRLNLLAHIAKPLTLLHSHGLHYGDINPNNVVLGTNMDQPRVMLVDCDSIRTGQTNEGPPLNAPGWEPPEGGASTATDCYKFALLIARTLGCSSDQAALEKAANSQRLGISPGFNTILLAGLSASPNRRPSMDELGKALAHEATHTAAATLPSALPAPPPTTRNPTVKPPRRKHPPTRQPPMPQPPSNQRRHQPPTPPPIPPTTRTPTRSPQPQQQPTRSLVDTITYRWRQFVRWVQIALLVGLAIAIGSAIFEHFNNPDPEPNPPTTQSPSPTTAPDPPPPTQPTELSNDPFAPRSSVDGTYVAVIWSGLENDPRSATSTQRLEEQLTAFRSTYGNSLIGLDGNDFKSLRDGTIAVAFPDSFNSAQEAADWCASEDLNTDYDCFGVVLSNDYDFEDRGEYIRVYPKPR